MNDDLPLPEGPITPTNRLFDSLRKDLIALTFATEEQVTFLYLKWTQTRERVVDVHCRHYCIFILLALNLIWLKLL